MNRIARTDVLDSLIPDRPMSAWEVARMLSLRGVIDRDWAGHETKVARHLGRMAREGSVRRAGRAEDGSFLWTPAASAPLRRPARRLARA